MSRYDELKRDAMEAENVGLFGRATKLYALAEEARDNDNRLRLTRDDLLTIHSALCRCGPESSIVIDAPLSIVSDALDAGDYADE